MMMKLERENRIQYETERLLWLRVYTIKGYINPLAHRLSITHAMGKPMFGVLKKIIMNMWSAPHIYILPVTTVELPNILSVHIIKFSDDFVELIKLIEN